VIGGSRIFAYRKAHCWKLTDLTTRCAYTQLESTAGEKEAKSTAGEREAKSTAGEREAKSAAGEGEAKSSAGEGESKSAGVRCTLEAQAHTGDSSSLGGRYILVTGACKNTRVVPVSFIVEVVWSRVRVPTSHAPRAVNL
jgi:hypothetical protein